MTPGELAAVRADGWTMTLTDGLSEAQDLASTAILLA